MTCPVPLKRATTVCRAAGKKLPMDPDISHSQRPSTTRPAVPSLDITGPTVERSQFTVALSESVEIETKFFIPRRVLAAVISQTSEIRIEQHYFPRSATKKLAREFAIFAIVEDSHEFSSVRIRKTSFPSGKNAFQIEFKGKKDEVEGARISRREFGLDISESRFKQLRKDAVAGSIVKLRYEIDGYIMDQGRKIPVVAQVDNFKAAGRNLAALDAGFATVDIELPKAELVQALRRGEHSFSFLRGCVELTAQPKELQQTLATRRLAKFGLDAERLRALKVIRATAKAARDK